MSSDKQSRRHDWLEIRGKRKGEGTVGLTVDCPYRGSCETSVCLGCKDFSTFAIDGSGWHTYVVCAKAEPNPNDPQALVERQFADASGAPWTVTAFARERHDGTWDGWLEWLSPDGNKRYGGCEANERTRDAIVAWAEGLSAWSCRGFLIAREAVANAG